MTPLSAFWLIILMFAFLIVTGGGSLLAYHIKKDATAETAPYNQYSALGIIIGMVLVDAIIILAAFPPLAESLWLLILG